MQMLMSNKLRCILLPVLLLNALCAGAQDMEPRAYSNTPIGMNFLIVGYGYTDGGLYFDPSLPITDAHATVNLGLFAVALEPVSQLYARHHYRRDI